MGSFISKQPNGLYCRFSTVVDCPTDWNMTEEDYLELRAEMAREDAKWTLTHHLRPFEMVKEYFHPNNMTEEEFNKCLDEMSLPVEQPQTDALPYTHTDPVLNAHITEIIDDFRKVVEKAKSYGLDIKLTPFASNSLELYFHDDYPGVILVDKSEYDGGYRDW